MSIKPEIALEALQAYSRGENVTLHLKKKFPQSIDKSQIIEIAYDLQAGTYTEFSKRNSDYIKNFCAEACDLLAPFIPAHSIVLDVGCGEMTTTLPIIRGLKSQGLRCYGCDISWSRLKVAQKNIEDEETGAKFSKFRSRPKLFCADISKLPLRSKSVDITMSVHAVEPNGSDLMRVLNELIRVTRNKILLFEPSYENNSSEGKARMDRLGYVKNIVGVAEQLGAKLEGLYPLKNIANPLNPTFLHVFRLASSHDDEGGLPHFGFTIPGADTPLCEIDGFLHSKDAGLCYPILSGIPILREQSAILASKLSEV